MLRDQRNHLQRLQADMLHYHDTAEIYFARACQGENPTVNRTLAEHWATRAIMTAAVITATTNLERLGRE